MSFLAEISDKMGSPVDVLVLSMLLAVTACSFATLCRWLLIPMLLLSALPNWLMWQEFVQGSFGRVVIHEMGYGWIAAMFGAWNLPFLLGAFCVLLLHRRSVRDARRTSGQCVSCGYDLTGNTSGVCPECGQAVCAPRLPSAQRSRRRVHQLLLIVSALGLSWLGMMLVHEAGHVLGAWASGGQVTKVYHDPFSFSCTILGRNPHPLFVCWSGPIGGVLIPLAAFALAAWLRAAWAYLLRLFAGFCLIANRAYIGAGSFSDAADAGDLLQYGSRQVTLVVFGLACLACGLLLWNNLGPHFGFAAAKGKVSRAHAFSCLVALIVMVVAMKLL